VRIAIVGMGSVGSSVAISTLHSGIATSLLVNDIRTDLAEGEAMDLAHAASFYPTASVRAAAVGEMASADAVVVCAGRGGRAGESRLDLLRDNAVVVRDIASQLRTLRGLLIIVSNPVDVLTQVAAVGSGLPPARVIGTGTMLDTARLRQVVGRELDLDPRSIHAHVVGEHGDSEVALWSAASAGGIPLRRWSAWSSERERSVELEVRRAAYEIIRRKGATNHAIGLVTAALLRWCLRGERRVLTVTRVQQGTLGLNDVALSLPCIVSTAGAEEVLTPEMDSGERDALMRSAEVVRKAWAGLGS
jgi:L-lactate dehydrogenase